MSYKVQDHVVANLMQTYLDVSNFTYAQELKNTPLNYWPGGDLVFSR